ERGIEVVDLETEAVGRLRGDADTGGWIAELDDVDTERIVGGGARREGNAVTIVRDIGRLNVGAGAETAGAEQRSRGADVDRVDVLGGGERGGRGAEVGSAAEGIEREAIGRGGARGALDIDDRDRIAAAHQCDLGTESVALAGEPFL